MLLQLLANGFVSGCMYGFIALGFALIYNTTRIFHIAHGGVYVAGAYLFYTFFNLWNWPALLAFTACLVATGLLGLLVERIVHAPLADKNASLLVHLLSSIGLYTIFVNVIAMIYGNETKVINPGVQSVFDIGPVRLTEIQIATVVVFALVVIAFILALRKTHVGLLFRAMRDDPELLSVLGYRPGRVRMLVFTAGSALAAGAAMLEGMDVGIDPHIGMAAVLNGAVAVIIGGVGSFVAPALGGLMLGLVQALAIWQFSARWEEAVTFGLLILFLLVRPQGLFGQARRAEEVAA